MPSEQKPLIVKSDVRFSVIGPGNPYPIAILASDDRFSDLVGYFSLRQLGFEKLLDTTDTKPNFDLFSFLFPFRNQSGAISSIDVWDSPGGDEAYNLSKGPFDRERMYSLVVESPVFHAHDPNLDPEIIDRLKDRIRGVIEAYDKDDEERVKYNAQMLSTILSLLTQKLDKGRTKRRYLYQMVALLGAVYMIGIVVSLAIKLFSPGR